MFFGGESTQIRAHIAQVATIGKGRPLLCGGILESICTIVSVVKIDPMKALHVADDLSDDTA
jgi:hypothetical protein